MIIVLKCKKQNIKKILRPDCITRYAFLIPERDKHRLKNGCIVMSYIFFFDGLTRDLHRAYVASRVSFIESNSVKITFDSI